ncbi:hypothetical protein GYMLUDRAFT_263990, partial [Collybiopsis luxurians FD-317 M1]
RPFISEERKGEQVGWWTFKDAARNSLLDGFRSVTQLGLHNVSFIDIGDFHELICSFPLLESLIFGLLHPTSEYN